MTTTVESIFGDGRMVGGFFLNNQLTDFSFQPKDNDGAPRRQRGGRRQAAAFVDGPPPSCSIARVAWWPRWDRRAGPRFWRST
jgi:hypothetical protein